MNENIIEFQNVSKKFQIFNEKYDSIFEKIFSRFAKSRSSSVLNVLNDVSFEVKKGEMFGIVGKNGAGKTTILRLIAKILKPNSGKIISHGSVIPLIQLGLGFHPDLTTRENIVLYGLVLGIPKKTILEKTDEILKFAELEYFSDTKIKNFSSGMYARLAFSIALQINPDIILVDDVLAVGDISFQKKSFEAFMEFRKKGKTILYVSHDLNNVAKLCDRAMLLNDGNIELIGEPKEVIESYEKLMK